MKKTHWCPICPVSWPSGRKSRPQERTFLLAGNIVCHAEGPSTPSTREVTCKRCLRIMRIARVDTDATIAKVLARGAPELPTDGDHG